MIILCKEGGVHSIQFEKLSILTESTEKTVTVMCQVQNEQQISLSAFQLY